jgi:hypothetical protein
MATCPDCGDFLGERHRCAPRWRRHAWFAQWVVCSGILGAIVGGGALFLLFGDVAWLAFAITGVIGALIGIALL